MLKKIISAQNIEISGWILGLVASVISNYIIIPIIKNNLYKLPSIINKIGKMPIVIVSGLLISFIILIIFVNISQYISNIIFNKNNNVKKQSKKDKKLIKNRFKTIFNYSILSILLIVLIFIGIFFFLNKVIYPHQTVATIRMIGDEIHKIKTKEFTKRLLFERDIHNIIKRKDDKNFKYTISFGAIVLGKIIQEFFIKEEAIKRNITVNKQEIDKYAPASEYHREIIKLELLENKVREAFYKNIPESQDSVKFQLIRFEVKSDADTAVEDLMQNKNFDDLYNKAINGKIKNATAMVRDWSSDTELTRDFNINFSKTVFNLKTGTFSQNLLEASRGWYIIKITGHEKRKMSEEWRKQRSDDAFNNWMELNKTRVTENPVWMKRIPKKKEEYEFKNNITDINQ